MTVATNTNKVVYAGDGVTTLWSFAFSVLLSTDISLTVTDALGNLTIISSALYSVDLTNSRVTYPLSGSPLAVGTKLTILRTVDLLQLVDWKNQGPFNAEVLETSEDKITMALQQLSEGLSRAVKYGVDQTPSDTTTATVLAALTAAVAALNATQAMTYLTPTPNSPANTTVAVAAGKYPKSDGSGTVTFAGGQSPAFSVVGANSRIDLLCIDDTGTLSITQGIQAASPVPPQYPPLKMVIAEVTITQTSGVTVTSGNIKDVRPTLNGNFQQAYVDSTLWKAPVKAATTAALAANTYANGVLGYGATLTANANGALGAIDGVTLSIGDRLLVKTEASGANNGIYVVTVLGDGSNKYVLTRAIDSAIGTNLAAGSRVYIQQGTVNAQSIYVQVITGAITVGTTSLTFVSNSLSYRRPVLQYSSSTVVNMETGLLGIANVATVVFPDGTIRNDSSGARINCNLAQVAVISGSDQSGLRTGSVAVNTWYAIYAVKGANSANSIVAVADTILPLQANFATLNTNFGTNGWVYLGLIRNGDNSGITTGILTFVQSGNMTLFYNNAAASGVGIAGTILATTAGSTALTYTYSAGTGTANIPNNITNMYVSAISAAGGTSTWSLGAAATNPRFCMTTENATNRTCFSAWCPASQGVIISAGASTTKDISIAGFIDSALGIGSNPLL